MMYHLNPEYQIRSLGGVTLLDAAGDVIQLRSRKHLALLIYLVAKGSRVHTRSELASLLWTTKPERARHSLSQAVYDLRTQVRPGFIASVGEEIRVDTRDFSYDANELEEAVKIGDYSRAVALYSGPFGSNLAALGSEDYERWVESERVRLDRLAHLTLQKYAELCAKEGRWGEMCVVSTRLLELEPINEAAHRSLMRGLQLQGDGAAALSHFKSIREELELELSGGISEKTLNLVRRIEASLTRANGAGAGLKEPPFVGRAKELDFLHELARTLSSATVPAVFVCGPAGIGKTRLVQEFMAGASAYPIRFLTSRCYPAETNVPYGPIVDGLEALAGEVARQLDGRSPAELSPFKHLAYLLPKLSHLLPPDPSDGVDPAAWRRRLFDDVAGVLREGLKSSPIVWVIEDTHWIDETSHAVLGHICRRLKDEALLVVLTRRVEASDVRNGEPRLGATDSEAERTIFLRSLSREEIQELLRSTGSDPSDQIVKEATRLAAGNPLFALEFARASDPADCFQSTSSGSEPGALREILACRFDGLSERSLMVARATAVLGRQADARTIAAVVGLDAEDTALASRELYDRYLLTDEDDTVSFSHELLQSYAYDTISVLERAAIHLKVAQILADEESESPSTLARHYRLGGDRQQAFRLAMHATDLATQKGANFEAVGMAILAREDSANPTEEAEALRKLAEAELAAVALRPAVQHFRELLSGSQSMTAASRVKIQMQMAEALSEYAPIEEVAEVLDVAVSAASELGDPDERLWLEAQLFGAQLSLALQQNGLDAAKDWYERLLAIQPKAEQFSDELAIQVRYSLAVFHGRAVSTQSALPFIDISEEQMSRISVGLRSRAIRLRGMLLMRNGLWETAEHAYRTVIDLESAGNTTLERYWVLNNLAVCYMETGDWKGFETQIDRALRLIPGGDSPLELVFGLNRALAEFYQGKTSAALMHLKPMVGQLERRHQIESAYPLLSVIGLVSLQLGDQVAAQSMWERLSVLGDEALLLTQDRFLYEWFRAVSTINCDSTGAIDRLTAATQEQARLDIADYLKLQCIRELLFPMATTIDERKETSAKLTAYGMTWFPRFLRRWSRTAGANSQPASAFITG